MGDKKKIIEEQYKLQQRIVEATNLVPVTCGMCGAYNIADLSKDVVACVQCDVVSDHADFPDLFY